MAKITINNNNNNVIRFPRKYNKIFDFFMILMTAGLWIIWMIIRPKYY